MVFLPSPAPMVACARACRLAKTPTHVVQAISQRTHLRIFIDISHLSLVEYHLLSHVPMQKVTSEQNLQAELYLSRCGLGLINNACAIGRRAVLIEDGVVVER